jgi:hypothetical protein
MVMAFFELMNIANKEAECYHITAMMNLKGVTS